MIDEPRPGLILDLSGPRGETIFHRLWLGALPQNVDELQAQFDAHFAHYSEVNDDRALVVVGGVVVESCIDDLLAALLPNFDRLVTSSSFTFSLRILLLDALDVIPRRIVRDCDFVRSTRNKFAHDLGTREISNLEPALRQSLIDRLGAYSPVSPEDSTRKLFENLLSFLCIALTAYKHHVVLLNSDLRDPERILQMMKVAQASR